jgi:MscS family membrane protein
MSTLKDFWQEVVFVWHAGVAGVSLGDVLTALGVFLLFLLLRRIFARVVIDFLRRLTKRTKTELDDTVLTALEPPLRFVFVVIGVYWASQVAEMPRDIDLFLTRVVRTLIAFTIFWTLYRLVVPLSYLVDRLTILAGSRGMRDSLRGFFAKVAKFAIACLAIVAILEEWDFNVAAVLGGLGLIGMAVAFGAQNLIQNLFAGLSIFLDHIFEKGDWIRTPDVEGTVEDIGFRTTKIRRFDKGLVTIPNQMLAGTALVNFSRMTNRRIYWKIGLEYRTSETQLRQVVQGIRDHVYGDAAFETDPGRATTLINVDSFNDSSIDIMLYCFTKTTNWGEWMEIKEALAYRIKEIVEAAGAGFAFPSQSLYLEQLPFGTPELFPAEPAPAGDPAPG